MHPSAVFGCVGSLITVNFLSSCFASIHKSLVSMCLRGPHPCGWMMPRAAVKSILDRSFDRHSPKIPGVGRGATPLPSSPPQRSTRLNSRNVADPILGIPPEVLFPLIESPLQSASVYASRCSGSLLYRLMIPSFCVTKRYLPGRRNLRRSASPGDASVLQTLWTANLMSGRYFKRCLRMPIRICGTLVGSSSPSLGPSTSLF